MSPPSKTEAPLSHDLLAAFEEILGKANVLTGEVDLRLYSYDAALDRGRPSCALFPENGGQTAAVIALCHKHRLPFVARGAGTNLCGGAVPFRHAAVIAPTRMNRLLAVDPESRTADVEPGLPNLFLKKALEPHGLHYAPDPASQKACTLGGNIGTNAGGPHCLKYGVTSHHVLGLDVVLPDGAVAVLSVEDPGYDFVGLFVGSEGTLGIVTRATLNLLPIPRRVETMLVSFPSLEAATQTVTDIIASGILPATLEAMDKLTVQAVEAFVHAGYPTDAEAVLLIEVDGNGDLQEQVEAIRKICEKNGSKEFRLAKDEREREKLWEGRRGSYPAMARLAPNVLVEDGAVPRNRLPEAVSRIRAIARSNGLNVSLIFHAGDGNLHPQILFDERDKEESRKVKAAGYEMLRTCVELGGSISGEHGIGSDKREAMLWLFTPETLSLFRRIKNAFDPDNLANPDKLIPAPAEGAGPLVKKTAGPGEEELARALADARSAGKKARIDAALCGGLNQILEHDRDNFTVTVQAGMKVADLQEALSKKGQKALLPAEGTLGGLLASNPPCSPRIRDQILGMRVMLADSSTVEFGGKVMKNVAGYDAAKLLLGSRGTLGVILSVTLKTYAAAAPAECRKLSPPPDPDGLKSRPVLRSLHERIKSAFDPDSLFPSLV